MVPQFTCPCHIQIILSPSCNVPRVEKYRPKQLEELASHEHILSTLTRFIETGKLPHLLFYGPPGTGKTTTVLACARKLFGQSSESLASNVLELNASDDRGIDTVRDQIKTFASTKNIFASQGHGIKLVILDEADAMTSAAQDALRRVIEKYVKHVRFCLICNDISKLTPAIQSRCTLFRFAPLPPAQMRVRLDEVVAAEGLVMTQDGKEAILRISKGDMRKVLNTLQSAAASSSVLDENAIYRCMSLPTPKQVEDALSALFNEDFEPCLTSTPPHTVYQIRCVHLCMV